MKIALSLLCENPLRKTGLTSTYHEFVARSLKLYSDISWVVFVGPNQTWTVEDPRVEVIRDFPANDRLQRRLFAEHFFVPAVARARGADVLVSTGFVALRKCLPTAMHVFSLQHLDPQNRVGLFRGLYRKLVLDHSWHRADLIIANSKVTEAQVLRIVPELRERVIQAYEGLQHEIFGTTPQPGEWELLNAKIGLAPGYFLWLSNFYPYKQAELLFAGYAQLDPAFRRQHPLVMVGGDWSNQLRLNTELAERLGLTHDVKFLGWLGDNLIAPLYRHAVAHCLASREETFGRTVIESMACGTPVVVNDIPIMHEVTAGHGLVVDFKDATRVAEALSRVATDKVLREKLRAGGLVRARDFSFENFTSHRIAAIRQLVSARAAAKPPGATQP